MNVLTIDDREAKEAAEHHDVDLTEVIGVPAVVERLDSGDFAFLDRDGEPTCIERCEIGNLVQKLATKELESQLVRCQESYKHIILLVEGVNDKIADLLAVHKGGEKGYFRVKVYPNTRYNFVKAVELRLQEFGIEYIDSPNFNCTLSIIKTIFDQRTKPEEKHTLFKSVRPIKLPTKYTKNPSVPMLLALCPRLSEKTAIRLITRYDTIWGVLNADDTELMEVEGFGDVLIRRLKGNVGVV